MMAGSLLQRILQESEGMGSAELGGHGEVENSRLPGFIADYRFFFNPIRYTSLGLSVLEAMMVGLPIIGLATTEMSTVIVNGVNGWLDTRPERLVPVMRQLIADPELARRWGDPAFPLAFPWFGTANYWSDQVVKLREQLEAMRPQPPAAAPSRAGARRAGRGSGTSAIARR